MISKQKPSAKGEETIQKPLNEEQLTVNGVTVGKSNLYNSIGRFGANAFHKSGDAGEALSYVCWKGDDGTTLAFESGESGGKDQTITEAYIFAEGNNYKFAKDCKTSKKVSAAQLTLMKLGLGDPVSDVEKKLGAPSHKEDQRDIWHHATEQKNKTVVSDVEVDYKNDKVTEIHVSKSIVH